MRSAPYTLDGKAVPTQFGELTVQLPVYDSVEDARARRDPANVESSIVAAIQKSDDIQLQGLLRGASARLAKAEGATRETILAGLQKIVDDYRFGRVRQAGDGTTRKVKNPGSVKRAKAIESKVNAALERAVRDPGYAKKLIAAEMATREEIEAYREAHPELAGETASA